MPIVSSSFSSSSPRPRSRPRLLVLEIVFSITRTMTTRIKDEGFRLYSPLKRRPVRGPGLRTPDFSNIAGRVPSRGQPWSTCIRVLSRRDCALQPRVARNELPWECVQKHTYPKRGCVSFRSLVPQPIQGCACLDIFTQGGSFHATLGFVAESHRDSRNGHPGFARKGDAPSQIVGGK
jgi:hypothetical protein